VPSTGPDQDLRTSRKNCTFLSVWLHTEVQLFFKGVCTYCIQSSAYSCTVFYIFYYHSSRIWSKRVLIADAMLLDTSSDLKHFVIIKETKIKNRKITFFGSNCVIMLNSKLLYFFLKLNYKIVSSLKGMTNLTS
jgi:hypothetical protein